MAFSEMYSLKMSPSEMSSSEMSLLETSLRNVLLKNMYQGFPVFDRSLPITGICVVFLGNSLFIKLLFMLKTLEHSCQNILIGIKVWIARSWLPILGIIACIACLNWTPKVYEPLSKDWNLYASIWQSSKYLSPCLKHWEMTSNYWDNMLIPTFTPTLSFNFQKLGVNFQQTPESPAVFPNLC